MARGLLFLFQGFYKCSGLYKGSVRVSKRTLEGFKKDTLDEVL